MSQENLLFCIVIPVYNHGVQIEQTMKRLRAINPCIHCFLIDDGSDLACREILQKIEQQESCVSLISLPNNLGKGGAVKAGLREAHRLGYSHGVQIDADGQHNLNDLERFLDEARADPDRLVVGQPVFDLSIPRLRLYARYLTHFWVWLNSLSLGIRDSMCGYRVYPLEYTVRLLDEARTGDRMDFDPEFLVRWSWRNWPIGWIPTEVKYPEHGVSHFRGFEDNYLISCMHGKLFVGMLLRLPVILYRRVANKRG